MKIIALYSIKGGVGKTASAVNLAYCAAQDGFQTLLCDLDPQGSASFYFRIRPAKKLSSKRLLKGGKNVDRNIRGTDYENLDLLPAKLSYRNLDLALDAQKNSKTRLKKVIQPLRDEYQLLFLDCPPNITLLAENVFRAVDTIVVPVIPTTLSLLTHKKLVGFFKKQRLPRSKICTFYSMVEKRKKIHAETISQEVLPNMFETQIPYLADIEKMGIHRQPVSCFRPNSRAARAYENLWSDLKTAVLDQKP